MERRILVVDDDVDLLHMLAIVLSEEGYDVGLARAAEEAYTRVERETPDLILMDLMLPIENGFVVAERLKQQLGPDIPIIAMSASDLMLNRARARACFDGWLPKPFTLKTLLHYAKVACEVS